MQLKLIGAICIVTGCGGFGFLLASQQIQRIRLLENLVALLDCMECELNYRCTPLPQLCRVSANQNRGKITEIFLAFADELESQIAPNPELCMASVLDRIRYVDPVIFNLLHDLSVNLGKFDMEGQLRGLENIRVSCRYHLEQLMQNKERRLRSYQTLGLCAGAAIAILFV